MKFYNREKELKQLKEIGEMSLHNAQMTVLMGRRRIGKTKLLFKATEGIPTLYFFVARKSEPMLCQDFIEEINSVLKLPVLRSVVMLWKTISERNTANPVYIQTWGAIGIEKEKTKSI